MTRINVECNFEVPALLLRATFIMYMGQPTICYDFPSIFFTF